MPKPSPTWKRLFNNQGFDWSFRMRAGDARGFFAPTPESGKILAHKKEALRRFPERYLAETDGASPLVDHLADLAESWGIIPEKPAGDNDLRTLSLQLEPNILLVDADSLSLVGACVCMPSSWSLSDAIGKPVHAVHASVPRLNPRIGQHIDRFLRNMPPGKSFGRANWSITLTDDLDYHPELKRSRPNRATSPENLYLRLEHQLFTSIRDGILMGIRIEAVPFSEIPEDSQAWKSLAETIRTMPDDVASYKGMLDYRSSLVECMLD